MGVDDRPKKTCLDYLRETLNKAPLKPLYDVERVNGELVYTPVVPIKRISFKIRRDFNYNKNLTFAELVGALSEELKGDLNEETNNGKTKRSEETGSTSTSG